MNEDFISELKGARHNLIVAVIASDWNVPLRVAAEDMIILVDQIIANPSITQES